MSSSHHQETIKIAERRQEPLRSQECFLLLLIFSVFKKRNVLRKFGKTWSDSSSNIMWRDYISCLTMQKNYCGSYLHELISYRLAIVAKTWYLLDGSRRALQSLRFCRVEVLKSVHPSADAKGFVFLDIFDKNIRISPPFRSATTCDLATKFSGKFVIFSVSFDPHPFLPD